MSRKPRAQNRLLFLDRSLLNPKFFQQRRQSRGFGCNGHGCPLFCPAVNSKAGPRCGVPKLPKSLAAPSGKAVGGE
jgi:hypothetical protein